MYTRYNIGELAASTGTPGLAPRAIYLLSALSFTKRRQAWRWRLTSVIQMSMSSSAGPFLRLRNVGNPPTSICYPSSVRSAVPIWLLNSSFEFDLATHLTHLLGIKLFVIPSSLCGQWKEGKLMPAQNAF